jgi:hypothetical protein
MQSMSFARVFHDCEQPLLDEILSRMSRGIPKMRSETPMVSVVKRSEKVDRRKSLLFARWGMLHLLGTSVQQYLAMKFWVISYFLGRL